MKVLVLVNQVSGDQSALWEACHARTGIEIVLCGAVPREGLEAYTPSTAAADVPTTVLRPVKLRKNRDHLWWYYPRLRKTIRSTRPDIVHVHSEIWGLSVTQALWHHGCVVAHGADNQFQFGTGLEREARERVLRRNTRKLAGYVSWNSEGERLAVELRHDLVVATAPGVAVRDAGVSTSHGRPGRVGVGYVGRLDDRKGLRVLLDAVDALPQLTRDLIDLTVVGRGPLAELVRRRSATTFLGGLEHEEAIDVIRSLDVLIVPSLDTTDWKEQYGRVAVEALAAGVPVVHSDGGALPEVVGDGGIEVPQGDVRALVGALTRVVHEEPVRFALARAARAQYLARHEPGVLAERMEALWMSILPDERI